MNMEQKVVLGVVLFVAAVAAASHYIPKREGVEITPEMLKMGLNKPVLWIYVNDSEVNSRNWADFGSRESRVLNIPILNLFYKTIVEANGDVYRIEVIGGLAHAAQLLGGFSSLPISMQNPKMRITEPEEDYLRAAILTKYGGLWLSPSVISLRGFGKLPDDRIVGFGQDSVPMFGSSVPGFRALWVPKAQDPLFVEWERRCRERLEGQLGGRQVRGDAKSDWVELTQSSVGKGRCEVRTRAELSRDPKTNKVLELEDLFAAGTEGRLPFRIPDCAVYLVVPFQDLMDRRHFGWVLRLSEGQIMESDLAIRYILDQYPNQHLPL
jgi:hypothetical protein